MKVKSIRLLYRGLGLFFFAAVIGPFSCRLHQRTPEAVATVGETSVSRGQLDAQVARDLKRYGSQTKELTPALMARIQERVLRRMVEDLAVTQRAEAEGLEVTEEELDNEFKLHKERFRDEDTFADYLARANTTENFLRQELKKSLLRDKLIAKLGAASTVSEDAIARAYRAHPEQYLEPEQMQIRRLVLNNPGAPARRRRVWQLANKLAAESRAHPERFAALCRQHSAGPEANQGGDMGVVVVGRLPEFDRLLAQGLKEGVVSGIVDGGQTLALYQMTHHRPERQRPLGEVTEIIRAALQMQQRSSQRAEVLARVTQEAAIRMQLPIDPALAAGATRLGGRGPGSTKPLTPPDAGEIRPPGAAGDDKHPSDGQVVDAPRPAQP